MQKVVLITGCTDGSAGAALARQFQLRGCRVFATARKLEKMKALAELGIDTLGMDVSSQPHIDTAVETVREAAGGRLDILVNNAAAFNLMPMADQNIDDARFMFDVNVFGLLAVTQSFLPLLIAAGGEAVVSNVSSISAPSEPVFQGVYAASKAAVFAMSGVMRKEFVPLGVRVVTIMSGAVDTNFRDNSPWKVPRDSWYYGLADDIEGKKAAGLPMRPILVTTNIIPESATFNDDEGGTEAYRLAEQFANFEVGNDLALRIQLLSGNLTELITALRAQFSPTIRPEWIEQALDLMDPALTDQLPAIYNTDLGKQWWEFYRQNRRFTSFVREYSTKRKRALGLGKESGKQ
ncbi:hypothetical protein SUNI508_08023 [Seiridium unicorne]|uniref:Uncharacterized protein n=1 Tax=Seiridium unicorne TaxID=138068 RepID=A0ABR2UV28_9PEZI